MKVVIDTNILVSAILRDRLPEQVTLYVLEHPQIIWIVSEDIMSEYKSVLQRPKFGLPPSLLQQWFAVIDKFTSTVIVDVTVDFARDRQDAKFLACCLVSDADFFVTGDRDFSEVQKLGNTKILSLFTFNQLIVARKLPPLQL